MRQRKRSIWNDIIIATLHIIIILNYISNNHRITILIGEIFNILLVTIGRCIVAYLMQSRGYKLLSSDPNNPTNRE